MRESDSWDARRDGAAGSDLRRPLRIAALVAWPLLLAALWLGAARADTGPVAYLLGALDEVARRPWAPAVLLALYLVRPLLLVPITIVNLASGYLLGAGWGVATAIAGTLLSATVGYAIGRLVGSAAMVERLSARWPFVRMLRRRGFEAVVAGGLMYLHADLVNLPSGLLRIRFPSFLLGITFGNALTLTTAVLAGASVEGRLSNATVEVEFTYLAVAATLFLVSLVAAQLLRRRTRPAR